jgi:hypothetical protein
LAAKNRRLEAGDGEMMLAPIRTSDFDSIRIRGRRRSRGTANSEARVSYAA